MLISKSKRRATTQQLVGRGRAKDVSDEAKVVALQGDGLRNEETEMQIMGNVGMDKIRSGNVVCAGL